MWINQQTAVITEKCRLVPYREFHVQKYHEWMEDEKLREATSSERLPLDQEYEMQSRWAHESDKLTFIATTPSSQMIKQDDKEVKSKARIEEVNRMFGDINLFLSEIGDHDGKESIAGELEIMIARKDMQGKGYGKALLKVLIWYIMRHHDRIMKEYQEYKCLPSLPFIKYLHCYVDEDNVRSLRLFQSLGFHKVSEMPNYFGQLELRWDVTHDKMVAVVEEGDDIGFEEAFYTL